MTLRSRLLIAVLAVLATAAVAGVVVASTQRRFLVDQIDRQLEAAVMPSKRLHGGGYGGGPGRPGPGAYGARLSPPAAGLSEVYVGYIDQDGDQRTLSDPELWSGAHPAVTLEDCESRPSRPQALQPFTANRAGGPGSDYRVVALPGDDGDGWLVVGLPLGRVDAAFDQLLAVGGVAVAVLAVVLGLVGLWVWRLGLRPIAHMTEAADAITRGELGRRVEPAPARTEAGRLGVAFNLMLDQRQASEDRLRRFVADASHELRTPLTSIGGYVDLYRSGGLRGPGELDDALRRVRQEANRMAVLVDDLLLLARLDEARAPERRPVDLSAVLDDAVANGRAAAPDRVVDAEVEPGLAVVGDDVHLRQVVAALVDNAVVHTPPQARVVVRGHREGQACVVEVADDGPGMEAEVAGRVFERFYRADKARARARGGSGLGLAIVRSIVEAHGGRVGVTTAPGRGATFRVTLPTGPPSPPTTGPTAEPSLSSRG